METNEVNVLNETEWVSFVFSLASKMSKKGFVIPPMNEVIVRKFYYAFNQVNT